MINPTWSPRRPLKRSSPHSRNRPDSPVALSINREDAADDVTQLGVRPVCVGQRLPHQLVGRVAGGDAWRASLSVIIM
jgi:hypothetical protein